LTILNNPNLADSAGHSDRIGVEISDAGSSSRPFRIPGCRDPRKPINPADPNFRFRTRLTTSAASTIQMAQIDSRPGRAVCQRFLQISSCVVRAAGSP